MKIAALFSFNGALEAFDALYTAERKEIYDAISAVDSETLKSKVSKEKTMRDRMLYQPYGLNVAFNREFQQRGWEKKRVKVEYPSTHYVDGYEPSTTSRGAFREMDFVKNHVGVEIQFGKYAFAVYNVAAKMTIFKNRGFIKVGVEVVPIRDFASEMSTGVTYFEQFIWDLENRGVADIDIPVLILGITKN